MSDIENQEEEEESRKNLADKYFSKFGLAFQQAAEESGAGAKHDMFETSVVEVAKDDLTAFVECLQIRSI